MDIEYLMRFFHSQIDPQELRGALLALVKEHNYKSSALTKEEALVLLEALAQRPGRIGISARFAKVRALLQR